MVQEPQYNNSIEIGCTNLLVCNKGSPAGDRWELTVMTGAIQLHGGDTARIA